MKQVTKRFRDSMAAGTVMVLLVAMAGCGSFRASSDSVSNILSSPFKSSSNSSGGGEQASQDISDATEMWALRSADVDALRRDVSSIASSHGLTDWESDRATYAAIGRGLHRAGIDAFTYDSIASDLSGGDPATEAWIRAGWDGNATEGTL